MGHRNLASYPLVLQHRFQPRKVMRTVPEKLLSFISLNMLHSAVILDRKNRTRASSQQSSRAMTHSARFGGHIVCISLRYNSGPEPKTDSLGVTRERRDMNVPLPCGPCRSLYIRGHHLRPNDFIYFGRRWGPHNLKPTHVYRIAYPFGCFISAVLWINNNNMDTSPFSLYGRWDYIYKACEIETWSSSH